MSTNKTLSVLAASSVLAFFAFSPVYAESIPQQEQNQLNNSAQPDVDPGASKGPDAPIVTQEREQLNNSSQPDVLPGRSASDTNERSLDPDRRAEGHRAVSSSSPREQLAVSIIARSNSPRVSYSPPRHAKAGIPRALSSANVGPRRAALVGLPATTLWALLPCRAQRLCRMGIWCCAGFGHGPDEVRWCCRSGLN